MAGTNVSMGYSIPSTSPSTVVACGHGYIPHVSLKCLMVNHAIRFASSHGAALGRSPRPGEARPGGRHPHGERVLHCARGCHDEARGQCERYIEVTVLEVKLSGADVG